MKIKWDSAIRLIAAMILFLTFVTVGCSTGSDSGDSSGGDDQASDDTAPDDTADDDTGEYQIEWTDCPGYITQWLLEGQVAKCAKIPAPLDYSDAGSESIGIFIFKVSTPSETGKTGQLWLLEGGPGGPGEDWAPMMPYISHDHPELDVFSIDHRGVGNSAKLSCTQERQDTFDYAGCIQELTDTWGDKLLQFTTTNAALDLGRVIDITRKEYSKVFVLGVSYGTYWAQRYMQVYPHQADGVILDSICSPGECKLDTYDRHFNDNGKAVMDVCADDATCGAKMGAIGADPWAAVGALFDLVDSGSGCPGLFGLDRAVTRNVLAYMEMDGLMRILVPAAVYRAVRCNEGDITALNNLFTLMSGTGKKGLEGDYIPDFENLDSQYTLGTLVLLSELWNDTPLDQLQSEVDGYYFSGDLGPMEGAIAESGLWPRYGDDGYIDQWAQTDIPILMMNGTLDPQTTLGMAQPAGEHFQGAHQTFVTVPQSPHCVLCQALTPEAVDMIISQQNGYYSQTCGMKMVYSFLADPQAEVDAGCLDNLNALEFSATSDLNQWLGAQVFGTEDMWEGTPAAARQFVSTPFVFRRSHRAPWSLGK